MHLRVAYRMESVIEKKKDMTNESVKLVEY